MNTKNDCCSTAPKFIFSCSGAADVGAIADQTARMLSRKGAGQMFCLAGVGGRVKPIMEATQSAAAVLAIDGCHLDCVKNTLEQAGFTQFEHLRLTDIGMEKGKTPVTEDNIARASVQGAEILAAVGRINA